MPACLETDVDESTKSLVRHEFMSVWGGAVPHTEAPWLDGWCTKRWTMSREKSKDFWGYLMSKHFWGPASFHLCLPCGFHQWHEEISQDSQWADVFHSLLLVFDIHEIYLQSTTSKLASVYMPYNKRSSLYTLMWEPVLERASATSTATKTHISANK